MRPQLPASLICFLASVSLGCVGGGARIQRGSLPIPVSFSGSVHNSAGRVVSLDAGLEKVRHIKESVALADFLTMATPREVDVGKVLEGRVDDGDALINFRAKLASHGSAALLWLGFFAPVLPYVMNLTVEADLVRFKGGTRPSESTCGCLAARNQRRPWPPPRPEPPPPEPLTPEISTSTTPVDPKFLGADCEAEDANACVVLAAFLESEATEPRDSDRIVSLRKKACDIGHARACFNIGSLYELGAWLPASDSQAATYYERACHEGSGRGCYNLAVFHIQGRVDQPDRRRAAELLRLACQRRVRPACRALDQPTQGGTP